MDLIKKTDGEMISLSQIKNIEFQSQQMDTQVTVGDWLKSLLCLVWEEGEGFSGKRPWGDSGWEYDIYETFVENNIISGTIDEYGGVEDCDDRLADKIILDIIVNEM